MPVKKQVCLGPVSFVPGSDQVDIVVIPQIVDEAGTVYPASQNELVRTSQPALLKLAAARKNATWGDDELKDAVAGATRDVTTFTPTPRNRQELDGDGKPITVTDTIQVPSTTQVPRFPDATVVVAGAK